MYVSLRKGVMLNVKTTHSRLYTAQIRIVSFIQKHPHIFRCFSVAGSCGEAGSPSTAHTAPVPQSLSFVENAILPFIFECF